MQFCRNGPEVPDRLVQAHEDGRVVFFCGAGISYPAGLPGFGGLVKELYESLNIAPDIEQRKAIRAKRFDTAIGLLEGGIVAGRESVRSKLAEILTPDPGAATATHEALLTLSRTPDNRMRIVTTNFDRLFEKAVASRSLAVERFQAPLLPVPKTRWNGLVYLHGLLPVEPDTGRLDDLVVSSGDFGRAYLTEGWAARFVGELLRNYVVCFVGYSIDDPVLRYMTDALAADALLGEEPLEMFAFGSHSKGKHEDRAREWRAKNVTPILYREHRRHRHLHETLRVWAETYRDGVNGKEHIVRRYAGLSPSQSTGDDNFVDRMLWALSDPSGLPAKRFAEFEPTPSLEWLVPFSDERFDRSDLYRFGVRLHPRDDETRRFSLLFRPTSSGRAPRMALAGTDLADGEWDEVMFRIARWLLRHLDDPKLLLWAAENGGRLHRRFSDLIDWHLRREGVRPAMRILWRLLISRRVLTPSPSVDVFQWVERFEREGLTTPLRLELRSVLAPHVSLRPRFPDDIRARDSTRDEGPGDLVEWEIVLPFDDAHSGLEPLRNSSKWPEVLPALLDDFTALLCDAMDLRRELGGADDLSDGSYVEQPSIADHPQNQRFEGWTALIELARDSWLETARITPEKARRAAVSWHHTAYPVFKRLSFFAAAQNGVVLPSQSMEWLLADNGWWLWSGETQREAMRLLVALASRLDGEAIAPLERAVLAGPPRGMYRDNLDEQEWIQIKTHQIWLLLAKLDAAGAILVTEAQERLAELALWHPEWQLAEDERDEFPFWSGEVFHGKPWTLPPSPRRPAELVEWLRQHPDSDSWRDDDWARRCRDDLLVSAYALYALAEDGDWPTDRWREAFYAWSETELARRSWRHIGPLLENASDEQMLSFAHGLTHWLSRIASVLDCHEALFLSLVKRLLTLNHDDEEDIEIDAPLTRAINHPVGHLTEALLVWWSRQSLEDGQRLPNRLEPVFSRICHCRLRGFQHGRTLLASRVVTLFRVDPDWARSNLLPIFDWERDESEARAAWEGFFWSPRLYPSLFETIKKPFFQMAHRFDSLGRHAKHNFPAVLTFSALDDGYSFARRDFAEATEKLPDNALVQVAMALRKALQGAGDRRTDYWRNRVRPYLQSIWPKSRNRRTLSISEGLGYVCVAAQGSFAEALDEIGPWLQPLQFPDRLAYELHEAEICNNYPLEALSFLDRIVGSDLPLGSSYLTKCLDLIRLRDASLQGDDRFQRLANILRIHGQELSSET